MTIVSSGATWVSETSSISDTGPVWSQGPAFQLASFCKSAQSGSDVLDRAERQRPHRALQLDHLAGDSLLRVGVKQIEVGEVVAGELEVSKVERGGCGALRR